jgi:hypothetical protein
MHAAAGDLGYAAGGGWVSAGVRVLGDDTDWWARLLSVRASGVG